MTFGARNEVSSKKSESEEANNRILGRAGSSIVKVTEIDETENSQTRQHQEDSSSKNDEDK